MIYDLLIKIFSAIFLMFHAVAFFANDQTVKIDSLKIELQRATAQEDKATLSVHLAREFRELSIDSSLFYFQHATSFFDTSEVTPIRTEYYYNLAEVYLISGQHHKSWEALEQISGNEFRSTDEISKPDILDKQADVKIRLGEYAVASEILMEALPLFESGNDKAGLGAAYNSLGTIMQRTKRLNEAIEYYTLAHESAIEGNDLRPAHGYLSNVAIVHSMQNNNRLAIPLFKKVIAFAKDRKEIRTEALASGNLGVVYNELNELDSAEFYISRSLDLFQKSGHGRGTAAASSQLSVIYQARGKYQEVIDLLLPQFDFVETQNFSNFQKKIAENLSVAYRSLGDYPNALKYTEILGEIKDSTFNKEMVQAVNDAQIKYETEKKEAEIEHLNLQDQLNAERIARQRLALGGSAIGIGLLSFLLYRLNHQKKKLESQSRVIEKSLEEKDTLLREIHHRVKNNLQVISSLLGLQSRSLEDRAAIDALTQSKARVQSMSLIHQNLYQKDNLTGIKIKDYFDKLSNNLITTYGISQDIKINTEIEDMMLDVDTVVPLGLILNELLTNSLKYAFQNNRGSIQVALARNNGQLQLQIKDDGVGIQDVDKVLQGEGYGYELVTSLVDKLEGSIDINSEEGTQVTIGFSNFKILDN